MMKTLDLVVMARKALTEVGNHRRSLYDLPPMTEQQTKDFVGNPAYSPLTDVEGVIFVRSILTQLAEEMK